MSLKAMIWAMEEAPVENHGELAVLYALADRANDDGTGAYPAQEWISYRARCSTRTVRNHVKNLEERGVIERGDQSLVSHFPANRRPVVWDLNYDAVREEKWCPENISGRKISAPREENPGTLTGKSASSGGKAVSYKPSYINHPTNRPINRPAQSTEETLRDWRPTDDQRAKLEQKHEGKDLDTELEKFKDWHIKKQSKYKDWNRAFDNWLKKARKSSQQLFEVNDPDPYGLEDAPF